MELANRDVIKIMDLAAAGLAAERLACVSRKRTELCGGQPCLPGRQ